MHPSWQERLTDEFRAEYFTQLADFIREERQKFVVFPDPKDVFNAFAYTPFDAVRVVILGQDPYHNVGQAHGLSFSVPPGMDPPPSLVNIYAELAEDLPAFKIPKHGHLRAWADQGVLLLNAVLTVRAHEAGSHRDRGWERFTDAALAALNGKENTVVFILWGRFARNKKHLITAPHHVVLESAHPSPMSARNGFFGSKPFSRCNLELEKAGLKPIDWRL